MKFIQLMMLPERYRQSKALVQEFHLEAPDFAIWRGKFQLYEDHSMAGHQQEGGFFQVFPGFEDPLRDEGSIQGGEGKLEQGVGLWIGGVVDHHQMEFIAID